MSDRVAVMSAGRIEQIGTPAEVYENPATVFVADFLGVSNLMEADAERTRGTGQLHGHASATSGCAPAAATSAPRGAGQDRRAARARAAAAQHGAAGAATACPGMVERTVYVGASVQVMVRLATGAQLQASIANTGDADSYPQGTPVSVHIPRRRAARAGRLGRGPGAGPELRRPRRGRPRRRDGHRLGVGLRRPGALLEHPRHHHRVDGLDQRRGDRVGQGGAGVAHAPPGGRRVVARCAAARGRRPQSTATARRRRPHRAARRCRR